MAGNGPINEVTYGGATFDANQVKSARAEFRNGKTYYVVSFKTGAEIVYPEQAAKNNARIYVGQGESEAHVGCSTDSKTMEQLYNNISNGNPGYEDFSIAGEQIWQKADQYVINQFFGLTFTGSAKPDDVELNGCNSCTVDVRGGNSKANDHVNIQNTQNFKSRNNEVLQDNKDYTNRGSILHDNNGNPYQECIQGAGVYHEGDSSEDLK